MNFECPHCGQYYEADDSYYGKQIECQNCHGNILITLPNEKVITLKNEKKNNNTALIFSIVAIVVIAIIGLGIYLNGSKDREVRNRINYCLINNSNIEGVGTAIKELCRVYGNDIVEKHLYEMNSKENKKYKDKVKEFLREDVLKSEVNQYDKQQATIQLAIIALKGKLLKGFYGVNVELAFDEMIDEEKRSQLKF